MSTTDYKPVRKTVRLSQLTPAPDNLRAKIDGTLLNEMVKSFEAHGLLQPLLVRDVGTNGDGDAQYEIVAGHRRFEAARKLDWDMVPVEVHELSDDERTEIMLIENMQRVDLTPLEEARGYFRLVERGMKVKELAKRVGRSQKHVSQRLALIELPYWLMELLDDGKVTLEDVGTFKDLWTDEMQELLDSSSDEDRVTMEGDVAAMTARSGLRWALSNFAGVVRKHKQDQTIAKVRELAESKGFAFVEQERTTEYGYLRWPKGHASLADLGVDVKAHRKEPCHGIGVEITHSGPKSVEVCTTRSRHTAKGSSDVKPNDIEEQQAKRQAEREARQAEKDRLEALLDAQAAAIDGARKAELVDLVTRWLAGQATSVNDPSMMVMLRLIGVDASEANSATERSALLDKALDGASLMALLRIAAAATFVLPNVAWEDPTRMREAQKALVDPYIS